MARYTSLYEPANMSGPGDARPTASQIIKDENRLDGSLSGKVAIVTGCTSGIGPATAAALHESGMDVWIAGRNVSSRIDVALKPYNLSSEHPRIHPLELDLSELKRVREAASKFLEESNGRLNVLINNAGIMAAPQGMMTKDNFDVQFGTNHLGHFLFFTLVKDAMLASSTPEFHSRVVNVSSSGHRFGDVRFDDYNFTKRPEEYGDGYRAYGQSKTANIWMANQIERNYGESGLHGFSLMPGGIITELQRHNTSDMIELRRTPEVQRLMRGVEQGAATSVWAAVARELEGKGGKFLENCEVIGPAPKDWSVLDYGYAPWAYNPEGEEKLWELSLELVGQN